MSDKQLQYSFNAKRSRGLVAELERLVEFADYMDKLANYDSRGVAQYRITDIRLQLDVIWDEQVKLFYEIQDEYKEEQRATVVARMKVHKEPRVRFANRRNY